jgi:hypothetical protein
MRRWRLAMLSIVTIFCLCSTGFAAQTAATTSGIAAQVKEEDRLPIYPRDEWQFFVSPYLWITGVNANITSLGGTDSIHVPWWDVAGRLFTNAIGVMGRAEAWKGRWGLILDSYFLYVGISGSHVADTKTKTLGPVDFTLSKQVNLGDATIRLNIPGQASGNITLTPSGSVTYISRIASFDLGGRFLVGTWPMAAGQQFPVISLEALGGLRFNSWNQFIKFGISNIRVGTANIDIRRLTLSAERQTIRNAAHTLDYTLQVWEPFIGPRVSIWLNPKFVLTFKGTVGGFGLVAYNNLTCDLEALLGYRVNKSLYAYGGYKARGTWFSVGEGQTKVSVAGWLNGPVLGFAYKF